MHERLKVTIPSRSAFNNVVSYTASVPEEQALKHRGGEPDKIDTRQANKLVML